MSTSMHFARLSKVLSNNIAIVSFSVGKDDFREFVARALVAQRFSSREDYPVASL